MAKEKKSFIDNWRTNFPNPIKTVRINGDSDYASQFMGEADLLTYQTRNRMKLGKLNQLRSTRRFSDGTQITVTSVFGHDIINIDVTKSEFMEGARQTCTIMFVYLNEYVQPMRYPGEVKVGEQEGIDYIKTYYHFDRSHCSLCENEVEWEFTFDYATTEQIDYYDSEPNNHCVISQDKGCSGEVIEQSQDENGTYIIWKAYTEATDHSRSGLAYMSFRAMLKNRKTQEVVCEISDIIGVDCCIKDGLASPDVYWEDWTGYTCPTFITYSGANICAVPDTITFLKLMDYINIQGGNLYAVPEVGGCLPYEWELITGGGWFDESIDEFKRIVVYHDPSETLCTDQTTIKVTDRCGGSDFFVAESCCTTALPLVISYTSLVMGCNEQQTLGVTGGCSPYVWALTGGGGTLNPSDSTAIYTSPVTNPDCVSNPTITVTDCCGTSTTVKLAVNCYTFPLEIALRECQFKQCGHGCMQHEKEGGGLTPCHTHIIFGRWYYNCSGVEIGNAFCNVGYPNPPSWDCPAEVAEVGCGQFPDSDPPCDGTLLLGWMTPCGGGACNICAVPDGTCGSITDMRTPAQKAAGCCPLNPLTGLPY